MAELKEYRCKNCAKILIRGDIQEGTLSKDCSKCGTRNLIEVKRVITYQHSVRVVAKV